MAERFDTVVRSGLLVVAGCSLALGAAAPASGAVSGPKSGLDRLVSPRYQAVWCDTATGRASGRAQPGPPGVSSGENRALSASSHRFPALGTRLASTGYQPRNVISKSGLEVSPWISVESAIFTLSTCSSNVREISSASPKTTDPGTSTDAKILFQLAVALAAVYLLFLAAWFRATRERRGRVGSAARS